MSNFFAAFATIRNMGHRLRPGMIIDLGGEEGLYEVVSVNDCRARVVPVDKTRTVTIKNRFAAEGEPEQVTFQARRKTLDISPNSECPIISQS